MPAHARHRLVDAERPVTYHIVSRCVRREWLFGRDPRTGRDHSHRRPWVSERALGLSSLFAVALDALAVMSNHFHLVLLHDPKASSRWQPERAHIAGAAPATRHGRGGAASATGVGLPDDGEPEPRLGISFGDYTNRADALLIEHLEGGAPPRAFAAGSPGERFLNPARTCPATAPAGGVGMSGGL